MRSINMEKWINNMTQHHKCVLTPWQNDIKEKNILHICSIIIAYCNNKFGPNLMIVIW